MRRTVGSATALLAMSSVLVVGGSAPSYAVDGNDCTGVNAVDTDDMPATDDSEPLEELQIERAQERVRELSGRGPGQGVRIAVLDSGVLDSAEIDVEVGESSPGFTTPGALSWYHGTAMAGIIAGDPRADGGLVGIAPDATIYDQRVYDTDDEADDELKQLTLGGIVDGLNRIEPLVGRRPGDIRIVNISLSVTEDDADKSLKKAVRRVTKAGAIVVASSGNRPSEPEPGGAVGAYEHGEDYADSFFPAGYAKGDVNPRVVSVGSTLPPGTTPDDAPVVLSSAIDVAVPTYGAVSYAINDSTCSFYAPSTSVAAAEVSGILALLMTAFPDDTPEQLITRLEATATGGSTYDPDVPDKEVGRGVVQPLEALTRALRIDPSGGLGPAPTRERAAERAALPEPEPDVLESTRRNAVWWGLIGGGALVAAVLLRPVLSRRRSR